MNNVKWHGDPRDPRKWAEVASDVCMAHKQRMDMARARAGAGPISVVHYDELVRSPMSAITSMYSDLGLGAVPREVVEYVVQLMKRSTLRNKIDSCSDQRLRISNYDAWSDACYGVQHLLLARASLTKWKRNTPLRYIRMIEAATPCRSLFLSPLRRLPCTLPPICSLPRPLLLKVLWLGKNSQKESFEFSSLSIQLTSLGVTSIEGARKWKRSDLIHIYLVRQIDDLAYLHRAALHEAVKVERQTHILENEVTLLFKGDLIKALSKALSEMQERFSASCPCFAYHRRYS